MASSTAPESADERALRRRGLTLALLTITYFFSYMDRQILAILLELIKADLRLTDTQLGLLSGLAFAIFYATLGVPVARLADRSNRRNIIAVALALWSAMTALCGLAQNFAQLLLARIGVGVGEAGSSPPSHSIIADLYPPEKRAGAMAIYSTGVVLGGGFGTMIGGYVASLYGWRWAMVVVGVPGILLALFVWAFVVEPRRGLSDPARAADTSPMPSVGSAFAAMWANKPAFHLVMAVTITSMIGYALAGWGPSFLQRSLSYSVREVALIFAPLAAVAGTVGGLAGGAIANRAAARYGLHAQSWMVAVLKLVALPFMIGFYLTESQSLAMVFYVLNYLFASSYLGPTFALIQSLAPLRMRAMWAAVTLLVINLIGLGLGPTLIGILSDLLRPVTGPEESLRWALVAVGSATPWAIWHYWRAGVLLRRAPAD
ncbi:spinster family MFS transporter [Sphingomonas lenta]|uniref:MFS transporter n=1 Tax=Sphingomonas lenta TaxID=1141887 RepID=A0A2A2SJ74_9SPHN|nr:MFS transporter [Sphingomonas lenta]PAX09279.1 MFS transporter [Sphingomonas lenta]